MNSENPHKKAIEFSFNWTRWPFVEVDGSASINLRIQLDPQLVKELHDWCDFMLANFDETHGFSRPEAKSTAKQEYERLCRRLEAAHLVVTKNTWWDV